MLQRKQILLLIALFLIALFFRLYDLGNTPSGFHRDEVISGYVGRYILENGRDIYGNPFPLFYVDKYGDYPPVIPMYLSGLATYLFGMSVFATRFPVALLGALILIPFFFVARSIFKDFRIAFFATFLMAIIPWNFILSRATAEGIVALFFALCGFLFLLRFIKSQKIVFLLASLLICAFTYLLYPSYRVLLPLLFLPLPFLFSFKRKQKGFLIGGIILLIGLTGLISITDWGKGRFDQTSMFGADSGGVMQSKFQILAEEEGPNKVLTVKTYHNKIIVYGKESIKQYLSYYSPEYLFTVGGLPYRYVVSDEGLLYLTMIPLFFFALISFPKIERRMGLYLLYLMIISPIPAPITLDDVPNVHRSLFMIVPFLLFASYGFVQMQDSLKGKKAKQILSCLIIGALVLEFVYFLHMYYHHMNAVKSIERGDTNKEVIAAVIDDKATVDKVVIPVHDAFPIYYLFFTNNVDPSLEEKMNKKLKVSKLDNVTFTDTYCPSKKLKKKDLQQDILIVDRADCKFDTTKFFQTAIFTRHDGTSSYRFLVPIKKDKNYNADILLN